MADNSSKKGETAKSPTKKEKKDIMFTIFRPNTGLQVRLHKNTIILYWNISQAPG